MRLLLLDTCGDTGSLALAENGRVAREGELAARSASAHLVGSIRAKLADLAWPLPTLRAVAVVSGPGSFTGVRVGLAAAKGLCEAAGLALVTLSRLELLLHAGGAALGALAVLDAGRDEFYVRAAEGAGDELLMNREQLLAAGAGKPVLVAEEKLLDLLKPLRPIWVELSAARALTLATARLERGSEDVAAADANYVRHARALYATQPGVVRP